MRWWKKFTLPCRCLFPIIFLHSSSSCIHHSANRKTPSKGGRRKSDFISSSSNHYPVRRRKKEGRQGAISSLIITVSTNERERERDFFVQLNDLKATSRLNYAWPHLNNKSIIIPGRVTSKSKSSQWLERLRWQSAGSWGWLFAEKCQLCGKKSVFWADAMSNWGTSCLLSRGVARIKKGSRRKSWLFECLKVSNQWSENLGKVIFNWRLPEQSFFRKGIE